MDLQRLAQQFKSPPAPVRARFGSVVQVNADYTVDVLIGGMVTDADEEAAYSSGFVPMAGTGGTIGTAVIDGVSYRTHTFTSGTGQFVVTDAGSDAVLDVLLVGGGGGGGGAEAGKVGGGGGGGEVLFFSSQDFQVGGTHTVTVGSGGTAGDVVAGVASRGGQGGPSVVMPEYESAVFGSAVGGGGGGAGGTALNGANGGSGGGGGTNGTAAGAGGLNIGADLSFLERTGFGNAGGRGGSAGTAVTQQAGGGGGGAGGAGLNGVGRTLDIPGSTGGIGGIGYVTNFNGTATFYAGGGGGAAAFSPAGGAGAGTEGGGGQGASVDGSAGAGTANTGGGGGGGYSGKSGGAGGSGLVSFRYQISPDDIVPNSEVAVVSDQVSGIKFLGRGVPIPGQTVLLLTDGADLLALDSLAQSGSTIAPRRYRTTNQSITGDTDTVVTWGTAVANDLLGMSGPVGGTAWPERLYAHIPGWYQATATSYWGNDNEDVDTWVRYNGSTILARQTEATSETLQTYQTVSTPTFYMAAGDFIEMLVRSGGGATLTYQSEYVPSLSLTFLGP